MRPTIRRVGNRPEVTRVNRPDDLPPDRLALAGAAATAAINVAVPAGWPTAAFIAAACAFWAAYVLVRARRDPDALRGWGFRSDNLAGPAAASAVVSVLGAAVFAGYARLHGTLRVPAHAWVLLLAYPVYGVTQQFLALAVVVGNLERVRWLRGRRGPVVVLGAAVFGLAHSFDPRLAAATFALELVMIPLYLWRRNLWAYGVLHGWLGALFWLWVLGRDPWAEALGPAAGG
jgi:hypothetical protein